MINSNSLAEIISGQVLHRGHESVIKHLGTDSRKLSHPKESLFFAIRGQFRDGHDYVTEVLNSGCRNIVVERELDISYPAEVNVFLVENSLAALQSLAKYHRANLTSKIIAVTGSNGKTIIKEWLYELLDKYHLTTKSPLSYNSQLGVPLSLWMIKRSHEYAVIEAGISRRNEMSRLETLINPDFGIFSNIGTAHQEGFSNLDQKIDEKLSLFKDCKKFVYCRDHKKIQDGVIRNNLSDKAVSWGRHSESDIRIIKEYESKQEDLLVQIAYKNQEIKFRIPFAQPIYVENALHCISALLVLGFTEEQIKNGLSSLRPIDMRLSMRPGIYNSVILDDTYNNDLTGLKAALDQLSSLKEFPTKTVIISDLHQTGEEEEKLYSEINDILSTRMVDKVITIGEVTHKNRKLFSVDSSSFKSVEEFLEKQNFKDFSKNAILIKGSRLFRLERIVHSLQQKSHGTVLEISLNKVSHNLNYFRSHLNPNVRVMAVIKAHAYGSGSVEMAKHLLNHGVNYLAVAYVDEGVRLRQAGITAPIMVMNPHPETFPLLLRHNLEPEIYSESLLRQLVKFLDGKSMAIHLKLETGMHRLGFSEEGLENLITILKSNPGLILASAFSHLAASEASEHDSFTHLQAERFYSMAQEIRRNVPGQSPLLHLLNTGGISRFPKYQFDMVRIGIGLHGYSPNEEDRSYLQPSETLKTFVSQLQDVKTGETVGYNRQGKAEKDRVIATLGIGYADGYRRRFSNGHGVVSIHGHIVPVVGNVCMDMTMIDVTDLNVKEGDEVIVFGESPSLEMLAESLETIPYEILSGISERVKRIYTWE